MKTIIFSALIYLGSNLTFAQENILVLEFKGDEHTKWHGEEVSAIACQSHQDRCVVEYTSSFSVKAFEKSIAASLENAFVVNMSFSIFAPQAPIRDIRDLISGNPQKYDNDLKKYHAALKTYETEKLFLGNLLKDQANQDKLFVIASGNGFALETLVIPGVLVSEKYALYPSLMSLENTLKVAALEQATIDRDHLDQHNLAYYSNYGIKHVDIAAPVPLNTKGEEQRGTSFAAPWVVHHITKLKELYSSLSNVEIKEMVMKSAYVSNIKRALKASLDEQALGKDSLLYKVQHEDNKAKKKQLEKQLGEDVMLVKSGGYLLPELLYQCAENYAVNFRTSIESACLQAQKTILKRNSEEIDDLVSLWRLRGI